METCETVHTRWTMKQEIIDDILDKYQIKSIHKLPFILSNDPISKYYNAKKGNLFRIERNSVTSGKYITYRCVYWKDFIIK